MKIKIKYLFILLFSLLNIFFLYSYSNDFPYIIHNSESVNTILIQNDNHNSTIWKISDIFLWDGISEEENPIAFYISTVLNYFLYILAFISFIVLIYWFSLVFIDKTDEGIKKWWKYIKITIIALIIIWISWLFSIWIFHIYNTTF